MRHPCDGTTASVVDIRHRTGDRTGYRDPAEEGDDDIRHPLG